VTLLNAPQLAHRAGVQLALAARGWIFAPAACSSATMDANSRALCEAPGRCGGVSSFQSFNTLCIHGVAHTLKPQRALRFFDGLGWVRAVSQWDPEIPAAAHSGQTYEHTCPRCRRTGVQSSFWHWRRPPVHIARGGARGEPLRVGPGPSVSATAATALRRSEPIGRSNPEGYLCPMQDGPAV
jgi:hypothetical protein